MSETCCASVYDNISHKFYPCGRGARHEHEGKFYCGTHNPPAVAERRRKRNEKWRAEWDAKNAAWDAKKREDALHARALAAIREIAAGHNDPRSLAVEVLALAEPLAQQKGAASEDGPK